MKNTKYPETTIQLTPEQLAALEPLIDVAKDADYKDKPIMIVGQFRSHGIVEIGIISHNEGLKIQKVLGTRVGSTSR